jgi:hypothetical protein
VCVCVCVCVCVQNASQPVVSIAAHDSAILCTADRFCLQLRRMRPLICCWSVLCRLHVCVCSH